MPHHYAVPGCTSNSKMAVGVSFHKFPDDIARDEHKGVWAINNFTRVCSLHFTEEAYHVSKG